MFHTFRQNNTGGSFDYNAEKGISHYVIVEGDDKDDIVQRAHAIGLYFDGDGDCPCCGNRWYEPWNDEMDKKPKVYGTVLTKKAMAKMPSGDMKWMKGPEGFIHYKNGKVVPFWAEK